MSFPQPAPRVILRELVGDGIPHPSGSPQNLVVRERIVKYLRDFGYDPQVQSSFCVVDGKTIKLSNIVVRRREPSRVRP